MKSENPKKLYRYRKVGNSLSYTLREIRGSIWCSFAEYLNDPFDGLNYIEKESFKIYNNHFNNNKKPIEVIPTDKLWGVACFSEVWDNPMMWAHYTNQYKGICIEYSFEILEKAINRKLSQNPINKDDSNNLPIDLDYKLLRVDYVNEMPKEFDSIETALKTKYNSWEKEREWRLVAQGLKNEYTTYKNGTEMGTFGAITKILLGPEVDIATIYNISEIANLSGGQITIGHIYFQNGKIIGN